MSETRTLKDLAEAMFDHDLRVDTAVHVPTMLTLPSDDMQDQIESGELDDVAELLGIPPGELAKAAAEDELGWVLRNAEGWAVCVTAPMHGPWKSGSCRVYLGSRIGKPFLADTYDLALAKAVEWVESDPPELLWDRS